MNTDGNKNFNKLTFIFYDIVSKHLRKIFRKEWDTQHPSNPWQDDKNSLQYLKKEAQKQSAWKELNSPNSGDPNNWDPTNLFYVLLYSKTITILPAHRQQIDKLRQIRNEYFAHPPKASINDKTFKAIYQDIKKCMISLNCSRNVQKQMEDVKNEILKVPEDYIKQVETDNRKLMLQKLYSLLAFLCVIGTMIYLAMTFLHLSCDDIDLSTRTPSNNSESFFPESVKPRYYIGHDWEINTGASVLANGSYPMVSITGPPAIGKTATAVAVGQVFKNNHGYQVAFVDFRQINVSSSHIRTDIYKDIVLSIQVDCELENVPDSVQEFKSLMITITTCPTLLIFDNIENILKSSSKLIFYEVTKQCLSIHKIKILTTSQKEFDIIGVPIYPIKLEPLAKSQSTGLLFELLPEFQQKSSVKKIAEKTGGIPLLLEVTASLVRNRFYEEAELLERFEELPILVVLNDTKDMTEYSNYYKLLKIVFDCLDPSLQEIFIALGTIPIFLDQISADSVVKFSFSGKVDLYPLVNYNLLKTFDMPSGQRLYGMHPVISEFTRLVDEDNSRFLKVQDTSVGSSFAVKRNSSNYEFFMTDYSDMTLQQQIWDDICDVPTVVVHIGLETYHIGLNVYDLGQYTKSIHFLLQATELLKDDNNLSLLKCLADFAVKATIKFLKQGRLILSTKFSHLLFKTLNLIETDPCFVATKLFEVGTLSNNLRFYEDAAFVLKQALTYYHQQYQQQNCSKEDLGFFALKLGVAFHYHRQYHASINVACLSVNLLKSHDEQLEADWILADSYYKTQDYQTCFQIVRRVLNSSYDVDYHKQKRTFQALTGLALKAAHTYLNQSNIAMASQFSILSLNTLKMLETDSCSVSLLYFDVGSVFCDLGAYTNAAFAFNQTWAFHKQSKCCEENLGIEAYNLGIAYYHCGQYNLSIDFLHIAVDLLEKDDDDDEEFIAMSLLASSYYEIQEHETSYQITRNILGNNSYLNTLNCSYLYEEFLMNLTKFAILATKEYYIQGKFNQSIEFCHLSIATLKMFAPHSSLIASMYSNLGIALFDVQRHADSTIALNKAVEFCQWNGCDEEFVGDVALYIGKSFFENDQYNNSIEVLLGTVDLFNKNPDQKFQVNYMLVFSYLRIQDYVNSFQLLRKVIDSTYIDQVDQLKYKQKLEFLRRLSKKYLQPPEDLLSNISIRVRAAFTGVFLWTW